MKKAPFAILIFSVFYFSCNQNNKPTAEDNVDSDTTTFFQVSQYIKAEIKEVNQTPYFIYKIDIKDNKRDSTAINTATFNDLAKQFYSPDINDPKFKKYYKENVFHDQTTKSFTISYAATNKELEVQNVEVLLEEDGKTVKRVFIRKFSNYSDSSVIEQLSWKPKLSFQINRLVQYQDNKEASLQTIVVWNEKT
jgi:hypothetical protein